MSERVEFMFFHLRPRQALWICGSLAVFFALSLIAAVVDGRAAWWLWAVRVIGILYCLQVAGEAHRIIHAQEDA